MTARSSRPNLREQFGAAVNASALTIDTRAERSLDRVAAMGAAAAHVRAGADIEGVPLVAARSVVQGTAPDARDVLASELVPILWHIRYGGQHAEVPRAIRLFAQWIEYRGPFAAYRGHEHHALRIAFSARVMHEWLSDRCTSCGGSRKQQRSQSGNWIRPMGAMQRNATFRPCVACQGSGRAPIRHPERTQALGLARDVYDDQGWPQRFTAAMTWLDNLLPARVMKALTVQLERGKKRA
jgi:hypothetical protein